MSRRRESVLDERSNAVLGWLLSGVVVLAAGANLLDEAYLWGGFALLAVVVVALPALAFGDWTLLAPWPILAVTTLAMTLQTSGMYVEAAGYLAVGSLALIAVVEIDAFTQVEMSRRFAVVFAVLTTMAFQGLWTVGQYYSDRWTGTDFLRSQTELQWDMVVATAVGLVMGAVFLWVFDRFGDADADGHAEGGRVR